MSKKTNYTESAKKMLARGTQFAKEGKIVEKQLEFANAYAKLARTVKACEGWIAALTQQSADPQVLVPFQNKMAELKAGAEVIAQVEGTTAEEVINQHEAEASSETPTSQVQQEAALTSHVEEEVEQGNPVPTQTEIETFKNQKNKNRGKNNRR